MTDVPSTGQHKPGILPIQQIRELCSSTAPLITPTRTDCFQSSSYDLTVGLRVSQGEIFGETKSAEASRFLVQPGEVVNLLTEETVELPSDICGFVFPINSQSNQGLLVLNPGHIDPGYKGRVSIKAINLTKNPMPLPPGEKVFTLVLHRLSAPTDEPYMKNVSEDERKRKAITQELQTSFASISDLVSLTNTTPFLTRSEVRQILDDRGVVSKEDVSDRISTALGQSSFIRADAVGGQIQAALANAGFVKADYVATQINASIAAAPYVRTDQVESQIRQFATNKLIERTVIVGTVVAVAALIIALYSMMGTFAQTIAAVQGANGSRPAEVNRSQTDKEPSGAAEATPSAEAKNTRGAGQPSGQGNGLAAPKASAGGVDSNASNGRKQ